MGARVEEREIERIARVCHETNRAWCRSIGDPVSPVWEEASGEQRGSVRTGVRAVLANPRVTAEDSHANWLATRQAQGWRYGPVKDERARTHPCMVPFDDLPEVQRAKDRLFLSVCRAIAGLDGG